MLQQIKNLFANKILRASSGLIIITLLVKILGYAEKLVLANYYGTSSQVDSYTVVLTFILSLFYFFREVVEPGFLNVFLDTRSKNNEAVSWNLFNMVLRWILFVTIIISLFIIFSPKSFVTILAPGFEGEKLRFTSVLLKITIPACIFLAISTLTSITLNGLKIFVLPASGELVFKAFIIVSLVVFYKDFGILGAAIGIVAGSIGRLGIHLVKLIGKVSVRRLTMGPEYKQRIWQLTWPLLLGVSFSQISSLIDNVFASYLQEGAIAALSYAKKIIELPVIIFPYVISVVIFPYFTQLRAERNEQKLKELLSGSLKWITVVFLPIAVFFFIFSFPLVQIIFQRGAFNEYSSMLTSQPLMIYSTGMVFFAIETILVIFYYANADTKTPVFVGMACVVLHVVLSWIFIQRIGYIGIALAFVIQKIVKNLVLLYLIRQKISFDRRQPVIFLSKIFASLMVYFVILWLGKFYLFPVIGQHLIWKVCIMAICFAIGGMAYLLMIYKFNIFKKVKVLI